MNSTTTTLKSSDQKLDLSVYVSNCLNPKGIVVLTHGMCEHKERYYSFIEYLNKNRFNCVIYDHRGHGDSVLTKEDYGYFYDYSGKAIIDDLALIIEYAKSLAPTLPCFLFSHSMGTLVAQCYLQNHAHQIDGVILCGQPCKNIMAKPGKFLCSVISKIKGEKHRSNLLQSMSIKPYDKKVSSKIENSWICTNEKIVKIYNNDPKCHYVFTTNGFYNLMSLLDQCYLKYKATNNLNLPVLFIAGEEDPVIGNLKKHNKSIQHMKTLGYTNIQFITYEKLRHEILNENNNQKVLDDILKFYTKNCK